MKNKIKFYYNLDGMIIEGNNSYYLFLCDDIYYFYLKCEREINEVQDIIKICNEIKMKNIQVGEIIPNIKKEYISEGYILIKLNCFLDEEIDIKQMNRYNNIFQLSNKYVNNWNILWKEKIDYLEYQIRELGKNKKTVISSFSYYIGLAENALFNLDKINKLYTNDGVMVLSRLRVTYPAFEKDYFNPMNFIFDSRMRDISEYLKSKFFAGIDIWDDIDYIFRDKYTSYEYNIFYARMLYPSYYFDVYEEVILNGISESKLQVITSKTEDYEDFLRKLYIYLSKYTVILEIPWILKK